MRVTSIISRLVRRFGIYSAINVAGLAFGLCAVVAIYLYVADELSYDKFHQFGDRVYRINSTSTFAGNENRYPTTGAPLAEAIRTDVAAVLFVARTFERQAALQVMKPDDPARSDIKFREDHFYFADPSLFNILTFNFIAGDASKALTLPGDLVINESTALRYFGSAASAMGKEFLFEGVLPLNVTGVIADYPSQSHLQIDMIAHFDNYYNVEPEGIRDYLRRDWIYNTVSTYVLVREGADVTLLNQQVNDLKKRYADERVIYGVAYELQPLWDIHLFSQFSFGNESANIMYIYVLSSIALLILLVACVNFVNLSTVYSLKRAREIGVRKVLGAAKKSLVMQFMAESALIVLVAFLIALLLLCALLPIVNEVAGKHFQVGDLIAIKIIAGLMLLFLVTALLAGAYPSFYITRFNPVEVLKGISGNRLGEGFVLRKVLVVTQFTISITLVVLAIIFFNQMDFIRNKPLGFQRQGILAVPLFSSTPNSILGGGVDGPLRGRMNSFESELMREGTVEAVTVSSALPGFGAVFALVQTDSIKEQDNIFIAATAVDYDFIDSYKMEVVAGRSFSREFGTDHLQAVIINEQTVRHLGWKSPENAVGKALSMMGKNATVVGVVRDFHFQGLQQPLRPLIMEVAAGKFTVFSMRMAPEKSVAASIAEVKALWDRTFPEKVFEYHFLDDRLELSYGNEQRMVSMMQYFSVLAIFICALGLFGLSAYINHQRAREVGIRKVLGASRSQIFTVLSRDFVLMVLIAFAIAIPFGIFLSDQWLGTFAYRVSVGVMPFVIGGLVSIAVVLATISYETIRAARVNPVDTLRSE